MKEKGQNVHAFTPYAKKSWAVSIRLGQRPGWEVCGEAADRLQAVRMTAELIAAR